MTGVIMEDEGDEDIQVIVEAPFPQKTITAFFKLPVKANALTSIKSKKDTETCDLNNSSNTSNELLCENSNTAATTCEVSNIKGSHTGKAEKQKTTKKLALLKKQDSKLKAGCKSNVQTPCNMGYAENFLDESTNKDCIVNDNCNVKKKRNYKRKKSGQDNNDEMDCSVDSAEIKMDIAEISYSDYLSGLSKVDKADDEGITECCETKGLTYDVSDEDMNCDSSLTHDVELNSSATECKEMSYSEYVNSLSSVEDSENQTEEIEENENTICKSDEDNIYESHSGTEKTSHQKSSDDQEISFKDNHKVSYPGIDKYFKKSSHVTGDAAVEKNETNTDDDEPSSFTVTINADIHDEPSFTVDENKTSVGQRPASSVIGSILTIDSSIELLSSEMIENLNTSPCKNLTLTETTTHVAVETSDAVKSEKPPSSASPKNILHKNKKRLNSARKALADSFGTESSTEQALDDSVCFIEDGNSYVNTWHEQRKDFLKSSCSSTAPVKSTQATLCFTKGGLTMLKSSPQKESPVKTSRSVVKELCLDKPLDESTPLTKLKKKKVIKEKTEGMLNDIEKSKRKSKSESKKPKTEETHARNRSKNNSKIDKMSPIKAEKIGKRSLRPRYKVTFIDVDDNLKTPIRMKFRRCGKNSSGEDSSIDFTSKKKIQMVEVKPNVKITKAQELLDRAKKSKPHKEKTDKAPKTKKKTAGRKKKKDVPKVDNDSLGDNSMCRRSSRIATKQRESFEEIVIVDEDDGDMQTSNKKVLKSETKKLNKKTPGKQTPSKQTPKKPKQGNMKIAPIFMNKKSSTVQEPVKSIPLDPEKEKQRKAFLMSGIPQELKCQTAAAIVLDMPEYLPIPRHSHIQQIPEISNNEIDVWNMQSVQLKLTSKSFPKILQPDWRNFNFCFRSDCERKESQFQSFLKHPDNNEDITKKLVNEIYYQCPQFPVQQMFEAYRKKKFTICAEGQSSLGKDLCKENRKRSLSGDIIIIENETPENSSNKKSKKRRSLRKRKSVENENEKCVEKIKTDNKMETGAESDRATEKTDDLLWTERYQPSNSSEIIGNGKLVRKLKTWLLEWKRRIDKEERKMRKILMKQKKKCSNKIGESSSEWWGNEDSDFDVDSDDTDLDDDDRLCNTVLLQGPHGIGKTATVYALAQEFGYKVFEVNASSSRKGGKILSQLQEATQSHQVSTNKDELLSTFAAKTDQAKKKVESIKEKTPLSFAGFFKTSSGGPKSGKPEVIDLEQKENKKKRKRKEEEICENKSPKKKRRKTDEKSKDDQLSTTTSEAALSSCVNSKGLELSSTSLILFDEVDIIFEEDRGFLAAVQSFMSTTKIPIILTTTDKSFVHRFDARYEQINFKPPSLPVTTCFLQMICLVENIRTSHREMSRLVEFCNYDIRHCMLNLQLWVTSGGGSVKEEKPLTAKEEKPPRIPGNHKIVSHSPVLPDEGTNSLSQFPENYVLSAISNNSQLKCYDSDSDFDIPRSRNRKLLLDDDSSNSCFNVEITKKNVITENKDTVANAPSVHSSLLDSLVGTSHMMSEKLSKLIKCLQSLHKDEFDRMIEVIKQYQQYGVNMMGGIFFRNVPLTKVKLDPAVLKLHSSAKKLSVKRKRIRQDMFDEDTDSDGNTENPIDSPDQSTKEATDKCQSKDEVRCLVKSLHAFSELYDSFSFVDVLKHGQSQRTALKQSGNGRRVHLNNGLGDSFSKFDSRNEFCHTIDSDIAAEIQVRQSCTAYNDVADTVELSKKVEQVRPDFKEKMSIPTAGLNKTSRLFEDFMENSCCSAEVKRVNENVSNSLPDLHHNSHEQIVLDYIPTLRSITKTEHLRQTAKTKRRFFHYFDSISLSLKESTMEIMLATFPDS